MSRIIFISKSKHSLCHKTILSLLTPFFSLSSLLILFSLLFTACNTSKFIPENQYLLDKVVIKSDTRNLDVTMMEPYIRQKANSKWFSFFKIPLATYSMAGKDSTKWINRTLQKMGEEPVLYDTVQARLSCEDLTLALQNMGYLNANVDVNTRFHKKKAKVVYTLHPGEPYHIGDFTYDIQDSTAKRVLTDLGALQSPVPKDKRQFTVSFLDGERKRIARLLNDNGYYLFHKEFISYTADSLQNTRSVDLTLHLHPFRVNDDGTTVPHPRYRIRHIYYEGKDSTGLHLRHGTLANAIVFEEGDYFSATKLQNAYNNFGRLGAVKYTNISFDEYPDTLNGDNLMDCHVSLSHYKSNTLSFQPEGTNTAGDLGAAASLTYQNRNLFRGSELFSIQLRAAYEAIRGLEGYDNQDYEEYGVETKLQFPRMVAPFLSKNFKKRSKATSELSVSWSLQNRPEFHRRVFSTAWRYRWSNADKKIAYIFDLLDLNYVIMPWISATFKRDYIDDTSNRNAILRYNYEDLLIMKTGFGISYRDNSNVIRANVETSGNLLHLMNGIFDFKKNDQGQNKVMDIAYAQYAKFDFSYTRLLQVSDVSQLALHGGLGIAYPYGNSRVLPFEKRYFSGGANSVRGWSVRELGPGKYKGTDGRIDFINQTGDLKLDLNVELRTHLFWKFEGALFVDGGNIWTMRAYDVQPGGQFKFSEFYKQIAMGYGAGLRLNFDYFILRLDMGMKGINPVYDTSREHYPITHPNIHDDFTFHFAVGLPF